MHFECCKCGFVVIIASSTTEQRQRNATIPIGNDRKRQRTPHSTRKMELIVLLVENRESALNGILRQRWQFSGLFLTEYFYWNCTSVCVLIAFEMCALLSCSDLMRWDEIAMMTNATCRQRPIMFGLRGLHIYIYVLNITRIMFILHFTSYRVYWGNPNLTILLGLFIFILLSQYNCEIYSRCIQLLYAMKLWFYRTVKTTVLLVYFSHWRCVVACDDYFTYSTNKYGAQEMISDQMNLCHGPIFFYNIISKYCPKFFPIQNHLDLV